MYAGCGSVKKLALYREFTTKSFTFSQEDHLSTEHQARTPSCRTESEITT